MKLIAAGLCLALTTTLALAATPEETIRTPMEELQSQITRNRAEYKASPDKFYAVVDQVALPHFDLDRVGRLTLGATWRQATDSQRSRLTAALRRILVQGYADAVLAQEESAQMDWLPAEAGDRSTSSRVKVAFSSGNNAPFVLTYFVALSDDVWKIYDVSLDGISLATGLRAQFKSEIAKNGLEGLIQRLDSAR